MTTILLAKYLTEKVLHLKLNPLKSELLWCIILWYHHLLDKSTFAFSFAKVRRLDQLTPSATLECT